ncbi:MAG: beta-lactamase family protein [Planctomycetes bacterium]|nr:beta-lactamase family protein [Planctomycetota bacterium]
MFLPVLLTSALLASAQDTRTPTAFPPSTALEQGISPNALSELSDLVRSFVEADDIVGAELHVIVRGRTVLHEGYGWRDREERVPMAPGGVFCVRSMTKPLIGIATWMLVDDGRLKLTEPVAKYLPAFEGDGLRAVTIEQLLRHESGLPMSLIIADDPRKLTSVRAVADRARGRALDFAPGTAFQYSDQGTDTLTAVIEVVTGAPAEEFVRARLLEPLGMTSTACLLPESHPLRARLCSAYSGAPRSWTRFFGPKDPALFPVFLGSQSLYSTTEDYARFLDLLLHKGRSGGERLLRASSVRRALTPGGFPMPAATGFPGLKPEYGTLLQLWTQAGGEDDDSEVVVFGHGGSDGTHAWAFPEQDALVLYFTQSRSLTSASTSLRVEERLAALFLGKPFDPLEVAPPLEPYLGLYWEGEGDVYRAIVRDGRELALEVPGRAVVPLDYIGEHRWKLRPEPANVIAFDRDEHGVVTGYHIGEHKEVRVVPAPDLPTADEVATRVAAAHHVERLAETGPVRMRERVEFQKLDRSLHTTTWLAWPDRWRIDEAGGAEFSRMAFDGTVLRQATGDTPVAPIEGLAAELISVQTPFRRYGDWRTLGIPIRVVQRLRRDDEEAVVVRLGAQDAPAMTLYVDWKTGLVKHLAGWTFIEGMGRVGQRVNFSDFRDVGGAMLPWRTKLELAHPLIGTIESVVEEVELRAETPAGLFELRD